MPLPGSGIGMLIGINVEIAVVIETWDSARAEAHLRWSSLAAAVKRLCANITGQLDYAPVKVTSPRGVTAGTPRSSRRD